MKNRILNLISILKCFSGINPWLICGINVVTTFNLMLWIVLWLDYALKFTEVGVLTVVLLLIAFVMNMFGIYVLINSIFTTLLLVQEGKIEIRIREVINKRF